MIETQEVYHPIYTNTDKFIILITGGRGCEKPTQEVIMADLTIKQIKDIKVGDLVMGVDGTPRKVIDTHTGRSQMYRVKQSNADDYYVNDGHILTLQQEEDGKIIDIPISWWFLFDFDKRKSCRRYGCKVKDAFNGDFSIEQTDITISDAGIGDWVGIELDGDKRYLHSDGTVTHNSGKSFNASTFIERLTFELNKYIEDSGEVRKIVHNILYTRYTMTSANISVIPEFLEKIEADGTQQYFSATRTDVTNLLTGSTIMFRGIKTSSGNQTAKLKSIHGITTFVCDEAEEWTSEKEFDTIMLSIRTKGIQNRIIIIMNPTDSNHFIYQKYIKDTHKIVEYDGVPVQISTHPNVLHIHTSYLDNREHLSEEFIKEVELMKENNPEKYAHIVMGRWSDVAEGAIFKKWGIVDSFPAQCRHVARGLDFGYTCFSGDTLIMTKRGLVPIKDVKAGDYALTRQGYRLVKNCLYNGVKEVVEKEITISGHKYIIAATNEHNFNINGKWKKYVELTKGDNLCVLLNLMGEFSNDTQMANTQTITTAGGNKMGSTNKNCCIKRFGSFIMEKCQMGISFITKTITRLITQLKTYNWLHGQNILRYIKTLIGTMRSILITLNCMVSQKKIGNNEERLLMIDCNANKKLASGVVGNINPQTCTNNSVATSADEIGNYNQKKILLSTHASVVEQNSMQVSTQSNLHAQESVLSSYRQVSGVRITNTYKTDVYDLEIEGVHEYFANSILVHNCDPSACVKVGVWNNDLYVDEQFYKTGMSTAELIRELKKDNTAVYSESADPRLVDEIAMSGVLIYPVDKSGQSILAGIEGLKDYDNIFVTKRSYNIQEELRNYTWDKDKNGNYINQPIDAYNHGADSLRYWYIGKMLGKILRKKENGKVNNNISNFGF